MKAYLVSSSVSSVARKCDGTCEVHSGLGECLKVLDPAVVNVDHFALQDETQSMKDLLDDKKNAPGQFLKR